MKIFVLIFIVISILRCKADGLPENLPPGVKYDKRTNLYSIRKDGEVFKYYKDGKLYERCEINDSGKLHGLCETFLHSSGDRIAWGNFKNGQRDGEWIWTFEDGSIFLKQNYTYGKKKDFWIPVEEWGNEDGAYQRFYATGKLEEKGFYSSGNRSGNWVKYYPNGTLEYIGSFREGKRVGSWKHYYPGGNLEAEEEYNPKGELILRKTYYPNGLLWCVVDSSLQAKCSEPKK